MKSLAGLLLTTIKGGVLVLVPLLLVYLAVVEMLEIIAAISEPVQQYLPEDSWLHGDILSVLILILLAFLVGVGTQIGPVRKLGKKLEQATLGKIPTYRAIKHLSHGMLGVKKGKYKAGLLCTNDSWQLVYVIEEKGDLVTIIQPYIPDGMSGSLLVVHRDQVQPVDASMGDVIGVLSHWGEGAQDLLKKVKN